MTLTSLLRRTCGTAVLAGTVFFSLAPSANAQTAYAISNGTTLISFSLQNPTLITTVGTFSGATTSLDGMDFRVANGLLYGYEQVENGPDLIVTVNLSNAATTLVANPSAESTTFNLGIDFNPAADRLRVVNTQRQNLRINVADGATTVDGTLTYSTAAIPNIVDVAYTNNDNNPATGTQIYYIDSIANTLVRADDANSGALITVGALGIDVTENAGFDIYTFAGTNTAYATFQTGDTNGVGGVYGLYTINLGTGAATLQSTLPATGVFGLAIDPNTVATAAAPEPGSMALVGTGLLSVVGMVVRRRRAA